MPGVLGSYVVIKKVGEDKKFVPLFKETVAADETPVSENSEDQIARQSDEQSLELKQEIKPEDQGLTKNSIEAKEVSADAKALADKKEDASK